MGTWGTKPWDSDEAADWFGELMDHTKLAAKVVDTLNKDIEDYGNEIRAAAAVLVMLGRTYIWPVDEMDGHLELAASKLESMLEKFDFSEAPEFKEALQCEAKILRSRIQGSVVQLDDAAKDYWRSWVEESEF